MICRGPEIEHCISDGGTNPAVDNDWSLLPFMALSDGAHLYETPLLCCASLEHLSFLSPEIAPWIYVMKQVD